MDDKATVGKTINSWHSLSITRQAILLIGPSHTGRTTLAELIRKHVYGNPHPNLAYDNNGKYNLEGVISNKTIKVQTIYPALYEQSHKDKDELKIIDVPSFVYPPENKKWGPL
jgi:septin family protein